MAINTCVLENKNKISYFSFGFVFDSFPDREVISAAPSTQYTNLLFVATHNTLILLLKQ